MGPLASWHSPPSELTAQIVGRRGQVENKVPAVCTAAPAPLCAQPRAPRCVHSRARSAVCTAVCTAARASLCAQPPCLMRPQSQTQCCLPAHPPSLGAQSCTLRLQTRNWNWLPNCTHWLHSFVLFFHNVKAFFPICWETLLIHFLWTHT